MVETDLDESLGAGCCILNSLHISLVQTRWLLDENMAPGLKRLNTEVREGVVCRRNDDHVGLKREKVIKVRAHRGVHSTGEQRGSLKVQVVNPNHGVA
jgi:hypothetical protein